MFFLNKLPALLQVGLAYLFFTLGYTPGIVITIIVFFIGCVKTNGYTYYEDRFGRTRTRDYSAPWTRKLKVVFITHLIVWPLYFIGMYVFENYL